LVATIVDLGLPADSYRALTVGLVYGILDREATSYDDIFDALD
jgi:hypothetical protein